MEEYDVVSIEISKIYGVHEWHEDLRRVLKKAGCDGRDTVFLFTDTQIVQVGYHARILGDITMYACLLIC